MVEKSLEHVIASLAADGVYCEVKSLAFEFLVVLNELHLVARHFLEFDADLLFIHLHYSHADLGLHFLSSLVHRLDCEFSLVGVLVSSGLSIHGVSEVGVESFLNKVRVTGGEELSIVIKGGDEVDQLLGRSGLSELALQFLFTLSL
jgi:hypothetical protein